MYGKYVPDNSTQEPKMRDELLPMLSPRFVNRRRGIGRNAGSNADARKRSIVIMRTLMKATRSHPRQNPNLLQIVEPTKRKGADNHAENT